MDKITLPLDINNEEHLNELLSDTKVYGNLIKNIIKGMTSKIQEDDLEWKFSYEEEDFRVSFTL